MHPHPTPQSSIDKFTEGTKRGIQKRNSVSIAFDVCLIPPPIFPWKLGVLAIVIMSLAIEHGRKLSKKME